MKALIISFILIISTISGIWYWQQQSSSQHMQTWLNHTQDLLNGASGLFSSFKQPQEDEKLKALLPSDELDLSYRPDGSPDLANPILTTALNRQGSVPNVSQNDARELLPDMFSISTEPATSVKGQVHTDENDNIIGAEVHVAIPADM